MIDEMDRKLIHELQKNGRLSYSDLARMIGVVEGTIRKRVKNLIDRDIIKIVAVPNMRTLGYTLVSIVGIQVQMADYKKVAESLASNPNVGHLTSVTGRYDLIAIVLTRSSEEFSRFMEEYISTIPSVGRTETFVTLQIVKGNWPALDISQLADTFKTLPKSRRKRKR